MNLVWRSRSTNGRWGVDLVAEGVAPQKQGYDRFVAPGRAVALGQSAGVVCFRLEPEPGAWVVCDDGYGLVPVSGSGAVVVWSGDLQSSRTGAVINARPGAILRWAGYKGRESGFLALDEAGTLQEVPRGVLVALGVVQPDAAPAPAPAAQPPDTAMAAALRTAGLLGTAT